MAAATRRGRAAAAAGIALLAIAMCTACGGAAAPRSPSEPGATARPSAVLTEADGGRTVRLALGEEADLRLSNGHTWTEPRVAGGAVHLVPVQYVRDPGFREWRIVTAAPGTATITASGKALCTPGDICSNAILAFSLNVTVT